MTESEKKNCFISSSQVLIVEIISNMLTNKLHNLKRATTPVAGLDSVRLLNGTVLFARYGSICERYGSFP